MKRVCLVCLLTTILLAVLSPAPLCSDTTRSHIFHSGASDLSPHKKIPIPGEWFFQRRAVTPVPSGFTSMPSSEPPVQIGLALFEPHTGSTSRVPGTEPAADPIYLTNVNLRR